MTWLDSTTVTTHLGSSIAEVVYTAALQAWCDATREYVEQRRADLFTAAEPPVFAPGPSVVGGAALLAKRRYQRRPTPHGVLGVTSESVSGILRDDPHISRLLGIGRHRRFRFGAPRPVTTEG